MLSALLLLDAVIQVMQVDSLMQPSSASSPAASEGVYPEPESSPAADIPKSNSCTKVSSRAVLSADMACQYWQPTLPQPAYATQAITQLPNSSPNNLLSQCDAMLSKHEAAIHWNNSIALHSNVA